MQAREEPDELAQHLPEDALRLDGADAADVGAGLQAHALLQASRELQAGTRAVVRSTERLVRETRALVVATVALAAAATLSVVAFVILALIKG